MRNHDVELLDKKTHKVFNDKLSEDSLKAYRDVKNSIDTALEKGREEGRVEGRAEGREEGKNLKAIQIAKKMLAAGMDIDTIINMTDLSKSEIEKL